MLQVLDATSYLNRVLNRIIKKIEYWKGEDLLQIIMQKILDFIFTIFIQLRTKCQKFGHVYTNYDKNIFLLSYSDTMNNAEQNDQGCFPSFIKKHACFS